MNSKQIKAVVLGTLLAIVPLTGPIAHTSTPTPTIEEILAEKCAANQAKIASKFQGCVIVKILKKKTRPSYDLVNGLLECEDKALEAVTRNDEKYPGQCAITANDFWLLNDLALYLETQAFCFVNYFTDNDDSCYP